MRKIFLLSNGERLIPNIEGDICIIRFNSEDTGEDLKPCPFDERPAQKLLLCLAIPTEKNLKI